MELFLTVMGISILILVLYFNVVATLLVFKTPDSATVLNVFRAVFIWLIPFIGFYLFLRITQQTYDCSLHYKLVPKIMQNWIYGDHYYAGNPNADKNHGRAVKFGLSEMSQEYRDKY